MQNDKVILRVEDLRVHFTTREGTVRAVNGLDFFLKAGSTVGIVGESGCGKSVTARAIIRIEAHPGRIVSGKIELLRSGSDEPLDLVPLDQEDEVIRGIRGKEIGMIFQEPMTSFSPVYTVGNQITESLMLHLSLDKKQAKERAIALLDEVGIPKPSQRVDAYPFELSGGMRQRAMIAMALACEPQILIADEPTTALDVTIQAQILRLIRSLQEKRDMSVILITHNLGVVNRMAHRIVVMYLGKNVEDAPARRLFTAPRHPYTKGLLKAVPLLGAARHGLLVPIKGTVPPPYVRVDGCPFHPRCPEAIAGVCDRKVPAITELGDGHRVRCFLYGDATEEQHAARQEGAVLP
jgi:peptide/nickel transport system ATP-binding protein